MSNPQSDLWQQLHDAGIVTGEMPNTVDIEVTPWYVRVLQGFTGQIGRAHV